MSGRFCVIVALLMFSAVVIRSTPAQAAEPAASARAPDPTAAEHLRRATRARLGKRWAEAADAYRIAYEIEPRPEIAGELGVCLVHLGRHREAAEMLLVSLEDPAVLPEEQRRRFAKAQQQAEREVAAVAISANPATAEILIDGRSLGPPLGTYLIYLDPGPHTLQARLAGYEDAVAHLDAKSGTTERISLPLRERRPPPKPSPGRAPPCHPGADCGGRVIGTLRLVGFAAAGAALAAGAGMAIAAEALDTQRARLAAGRAPDTCPRRGSPELCSDLTELRSTRDSLAGGAILGFIAAGVVGGVTATSFWWAPSPRKPARIGAGAVMGPAQIGGSVRGYW